ncbi:SVWC domain-containing protein [Trichonephila clavata]|uniref:SVWC domain-containing protein n=1 Tax=Trichonephila clavata TaxID=2740835 RepID=A0A8X6M4D4_TRICU|nr:SVWC domain-containing protein [Trichonephila clavata]
MRKLFAITCIFAIILGSNAYVARQLLNTDDGNCNTSKLGLIPVGEFRYNDDACERYDCSPGLLSITGCGTASVDDPKCRLVRGRGHHPGCCPTISCD